MGGVDLTTSIITIPAKRTASGYVYIAKINKTIENSEGCYKIGSTSNIDKRMRTLASTYLSDVTLIAYGYLNKRLTSEKYMQNLLINHLWKGVDDRHSFWWSIEYFYFDKDSLQTAIAVLNSISSSTVVIPPQAEENLQNL